MSDWPATHQWLEMGIPVVLARLIAEFAFGNADALGTDADWARALAAGPARAVLLASASGHVATLLWALRLAPQPRRVCRNRQMPLMLAAKHGHRHIATCLAWYGPNWIRMTPPFVHGSELLDEFAAHERYISARVEKPHPRVAHGSPSWVHADYLWGQLKGGIPELRMDRVSSSRFCNARALCSHCEIEIWNRNFWAAQNTKKNG